MAAIAYWILQQAIIAAQGPESLLKKAVGGGLEGQGLPRALLDRDRRRISSSPRLAQGLYVLVALLWLVPDRRIEKVLMRN